MNQDWREKRIKDLFNELGREDQRHAPTFAQVLQRALLGKGTPNRPALAWRVVAVLTMLVVGATIALLLLRRHPTEQTRAVNSTDVRQPAPEPTPDPGAVPQQIELGPEPIPVVVRTPGQARRSSPARRSSVLISRWQSPTDFLLKTPGDDLLKRLPRLPDSPPSITRSLPRDYN